ncbi:MAG: VWA domain-containing protein [Paenarthrobacter ureafaciens]|nr:VWA domain-containing protein [Paenarthrobacter ureafaciens]
MEARAMTFAPIVSWPFLAAAVLLVLAFGTWLALSGKQPKQQVRSTITRTAAVVLLLLAALRPGWAGAGGTTAAADLDVFILVDTSTSMAAEDYHGSETRLAGAKQDVASIAKELAGARFCLITFDNQATVRMPLSRDTTALQTAMATLQPQAPRFAAGSSITSAGRLLKDRLAAAQMQQPGRPALVFYAGDGENTSATPPERLSVDAAGINGGAVLGYGTAQGGRMKDVDGVSRLDEGALRNIAAQLNLPYAHRSGDEGTAELLTKAEPGALAGTTEDGPGRAELYWLMAFGAVLLLLHEPMRHAAALRSLRPGRTP